ncbi:MAG TPA: hypothetical protein VKU01_29235 [Bryobacteraceae bacterium]|nr:hypothetical protein [Bryobacteraceae bacterium]
MQEVHAEGVRRELARILESPEFSRAPRHRRFLAFVVEQTMAGKGGEIKEYLVGLEVFDKNEGFDPKTDSTVRTEASKLRLRLERFYESDGRPPEVRIRIPKGGYAAVFESMAAPAEPEPERAVSPRRLRWKPLGIAVGTAVVAALIAIPLWLRTRPQLSHPTRVVPFSNLPGMEVYPRFSPDGQKVAYAWVWEPDRRSIYVRDIDGPSPRRLTNTAAYDAFPAWSPDGRTIAFYRGDPFSAVMLVPAGGGQETKLLDAKDVSWLAWSPDGKYLALARRPGPEQASRIYIVSSATGEARPITSPPVTSPGDLACVFTPDGSQIAFVRNNADGDWALLITPVQGASARTLLRDRYRMLGLDYLTKTGEIVFAWERDGARRLWRIPAGGGLGASPQRLGGLDTDARDPAVWAAATGKPVRVVFETRAGDTDIFRQKLTSGAKPVPFASSSALERAPQFSPEGSRVAFLSDRSGKPQIWLAAADGTGLLQLTNFPAPVLDLSEIAWRPDGLALAVSAFEEGDWRAYIVGAADGTARRLSSETTQQRVPSWSADGKWIYFSSNRSGRPEIWKTAASGGASVQVTRNGGDEPVESPRGDRLFYVRDEKSRGIWSMAVTGGPETLAVPNAVPGWWQVTKDAIYFVDYAEAPASLRRVGFDAAEGVRLCLLPEFATVYKPGMTISPDGGTMLYSKPVYSLADLVLAEYSQ